MPTPAEARRGIQAAISYLEPRLGIHARPPRVELGDGSYLDQRRRYEKHGKRHKVLWRRRAIVIGPQTTLKTYGEESMHYLHDVANPLINDTIDTTILGGLTPYRARGALFLYNWVEFLGCYAGSLYARDHGASTEDGRGVVVHNYRRLARKLDLQGPLEELLSRDELKEMKRKDRAFFEGLEGKQRAIGEDTLRRTIRSLYDTELWDVLTHYAGYHAADELLRREPDGRQLGALARLDPDEALAYAKKLKSWAPAWDRIERDHGNRITELVLGQFHCRKLTDN
jgi:hypothetical protein